MLTSKFNRSIFFLILGLLLRPSPVAASNHLSLSQLKRAFVCLPSLPPKPPAICAVVLRSVQAPLQPNVAWQRFFGSRARAPYRAPLLPAKPLFGTAGLQTPSKTVWRGLGKERLDIENPNPGRYPGQLHYHDSDNRKYYYDPQEGAFRNPSKRLKELCREDRTFRKGFYKGLQQFLGEEGSLHPGESN